MSAAGDARRIYDAALRSGWDTYSGAISAARATGGVARLVDCLRGRKVLTNDDRVAFAAFVATKVPWRWRRWKWLGDALLDEDFDALADLIEELGRGRGRQRNEPVHAAARLAEVLKSVGLVEYVAVVRAYARVSKETGTPVDDEAVHDLLNRPHDRRRKF